VTFFPPDEEGYIRGVLGLRPEHAPPPLSEFTIPWQGFESFDFYCKEAFPTEYDWRCELESSNDE
jgi:hypothetical protein